MHSDDLHSMEKAIGENVIKDHPWEVLTEYWKRLSVSTYLVAGIAWITACFGYNTVTQQWISEREMHQRVLLSPFKPTWAISRHTVDGYLGMLVSGLCTVNLPSLFIPCERHFMYLQYWHLFRCLLSIVQHFSSRQAYDKSLRTVRLKNPLQPSQLK